ncbi:hypothetical protein [Paracoccus aminophilus]|uniref:Uncharacterized protein n=1 Tax=Paracoccus aminophilus JCM 7686 TaxID=1367847 RepID=S5XVM9_PARAH|nr:hypothetical protein [Paracoccus aminophilus]AGT09332.1 hypothetical protein JCM7686_2262 [Paracoccus aminophilus JCM 7686]
MTVLAHQAEPVSGPARRIGELLSGAFRAVALVAATISAVILAATIWHVAASAISWADVQAFLAPTSLETQGRSIEQLVEGMR